MSSIKKTVAQEGEDIRLASLMIDLGARLQVLQAETGLSYERLSRFYREQRGCSPPKGMLPFSVDWYMGWLPNIHSSIFYNIYRYLDTKTPAKKANALVTAYRLYLEHATLGRGKKEGAEPVLGFTRAWILLRYFESDMVQLSECSNCTGLFITHAHARHRDFLCSICNPPRRARHILGLDK